MCFFFNETAPTEIYPLPLHDALPICRDHPPGGGDGRRAAHLRGAGGDGRPDPHLHRGALPQPLGGGRLEKHPPELQSLQYLVCRLLLVIKKNCESSPVMLMSLSILTL